MREWPCELAGCAAGTVRALAVLALLALSAAAANAAPVPVPVPDPVPVARSAWATTDITAAATADALPSTADTPVRYVADAELLARVLRLADERLEMMPDVACAKRRAGVPVLDAAREDSVVEAFEHAAARVGFEPASVRAAIRVQIDIARAAQVHANAAADSRAVSCAPLVESRERLDRWTHAFVRALALAAGVPAADASLRALAAQYLPDARWSAADREALLAALARLRRTAPPTLARARALGVLRIGTTGDYAPFAVEHDGVLHGADVELALRLATALGLEPIFVRTTWRTLVDDLRADRFDVAVGGISVTPERDAAGDYARPHATGGKTAIGRCADAARLRSLRAIDRDDVRVIVNPGGTNERFVRTHVHRAHVRVHQDNRTIFLELVAGRADAMFTDDTEVALQTRLHPELCRLVPQTWSRADKAVYVQPDAALRDAVDRWLAGALAAGLPQRLLEAAISGPI